MSIYDGKIEPLPIQKKTLTEQWREGTLPEGYYYVLYADQSDHYPSCDTEDYDDIDYWNGCEWHYDNDPVVEVLGPVPTYDEYKKLQEQLQIAKASDESAHIRLYNERGETRKLQEQLKEANEVIKWYAQPDTGSAKDYIEKWGVK